ncbi:hypothetical protein TNCV_3473801 [Trichonephila clavipes]|nr:hypothetical protein TNCV_3473801 [Trichonephila clavipes]
MHIEHYSWFNVQLMPSELVEATRGLLVKDLVILSHGQVTRTTPEAAPPLLTTAPTGGRLTFDKFNVHRSPRRQVFSGTGLELVTCQPRSDTLTTWLPPPHSSCQSHNNLIQNATCSRIYFLHAAYSAVH